MAVTPTLKKVVDSMRDEYLHCRTDGHAWKHQTTNRDKFDPAIVVRLLVCERCDSVRTDHVNIKSGLVARRRYETPKDYLLNGYGRQLSATFRVPLVVRELAAR